jgi:hypothetical protein
MRLVPKSRRNTRSKPLGVLALTAVTNNTAKAAENRLRRKAERQGLTLRKSRLRDPHATGYGLWYLVKNPSGKPVLTGTLDDIEAYLTRR